MEVNEHEDHSPGRSEISFAAGSLIPHFHDRVAPSRATPGQPSSPASVDRYVEGKGYRFGRVQQANDIASVARLLTKRYAWRGYDVQAVLANMRPTHEVTLVAACADEIHGTLTVRVDGQAPLLSETLYPAEIARLRAQGARLCEFGRLAFEEQLNTLEILGPLFHLALTHAYHLNDCTDGIVEINPRHSGFYQRLFGAEPLGEERICKRVSAPAVLLKLSLPTAARRAKAEGGARTGHRSIYPYCLTPKELSPRPGVPRSNERDPRRAAMTGLYPIYFGRIGRTACGRSMDVSR